MIDTGDFFEFLVNYEDKQSIERNEEVIEPICKFFEKSN